MRQNKKCRYFRFTFKAVGVGYHSVPGSKGGEDLPVPTSKSEKIRGEEMSLF